MDLILEQKELLNDRFAKLAKEYIKTDAGISEVEFMNFVYNFLTVENICLDDNETRSFMAGNMCFGFFLGLAYTRNFGLPEWAEDILIERIK
ncbi:hypothetical protein HYS94_01605 [Candidatus Daviesbacteria bacterium]|nr:hypothetical protein [Candidatus Daviesbacteria bacterium]